jgi:hypothetical protein
MFCCFKRTVHPKDKKDKKDTIDVDTIVYHGTLQKFEPNDILPPSWFSLEEDQSVKWIYYRYKKLNTTEPKTGYLHKFIVINAPNLIDINSDSDLRLEINANGNKSFSEKIKRGEYGNYDGYLNMEDQAELMLCEPSKVLKVIETTKINIEKVEKMNYQKTVKGWRL